MKYHARICRPRFEVVVVEFETDDEESVPELAIGKADKLSDASWHLQKFDSTAYTLHVDRIVQENEFADEPGEYESSVEEMKATLDDGDEIRYLLLQADVETGEGKVTFEPWFDFIEPSLLEHDIATDWIKELQSVAEEGEENFERSVVASLADLPDTQKPIIVPLKKPTASAVPDELPDPGQYHTDIPELRMCPLTRAEHDDVMKALKSIDEVFSKPQSVVMRVELTAALLAHATKAAYESAAETGHPSQAQKLYDLFERVAVRRSRELYRQGRA